jgi:hypothetical protein
LFASRAKRKLRTFKDDLERTDATKGNSSFAAVLEAYEGTMLGADSTVEARHYHEPETTLIRSRSSHMGPHSRLLPL